MRLKLPWRKQKQLPVPAVCRNCGTSLVSRYCHNCGQYLFDGYNRSIKDIIFSAFDTIFAWDSKLFKTLKYLLFFPGKLTKEYLSGKVICYVNPTKLFWFVSILFFTAFTFGIGSDVLEMDLIGSNEKKENLELQTEISPLDIQIDSEKLSEPQENEAENATSENQKKRLQISDILDYIPYAMFLAIPFFALLLQMFFYHGQRYYSGYLIFAFHFHTFIFILFILLFALDHYFPNFSDITGNLFLFIPPLYFVIALYVVYKPKIGRLIWKVPLIMFLYGLSLIVVLLVFSFFIIRYVYGVNVIESLGTF
jgi:Protein of unknown function (DUF3667).